MKNYTAVLFSLLLFTTTGQIVESFGLRKDTADYKRLAVDRFDVSRAKLPSSVSLANYLPPILSQGNLGSCVAWATCYYAFTAVKRIESGTNTHAFSPLSLYNRIKIDANEDPCSGGSYIVHALNKLENKGAPYSSSYAHAEDCGNHPDYRSYSNSLYDWGVLDIDKDQIRAALHAKEPVVIGFDGYDITDDYNALSSRCVSSDGLYTYPRPYKESTWGHAMVIIGYDDYKFGGAFLVVNSWGKDWGKDGFMWLRYKDIRLFLDAAYRMVPKSIADNAPEIDTYEGYTTKTIKFKNNTDKVVYFCLAYNTSGGWISKGYYRAAAYGEKELDISKRTSNDIYWMAKNGDGSLRWSSEEENGGKSFCTHPSEAFEYTSSSSCPKRVVFHKKSPRNNDEIETQGIKLAENRGDGKDLFSYKDNPDRTINANVEWNGEFPLIDPVNEKIIIWGDEDENTLFDIWYIDNKNTVIATKGNKQEIAERNSIKFSNERNAQNYLKSIKK
tara:strand:- start:3782 stop:5284 length:1503 start_codon:yes stop_codon:yes gene_type:complete